MKRRFLSLALAVALLFSMLPCVSIVASGSVNVENDASNENIIESGTCGENLTWTLDDEGTLAISGTGVMNNYDIQTRTPWYDLSVKKVVIGNEVTSIGVMAFYECSDIVGISIPDSVASIGRYAFCGCSALTQITIPDGVSSIGSSTFGNCSSLIEIIIPDGVTSIGEAAFSNCTGLITITIPDSVTSIERAAFAGCSSLTGIWVNENNTAYSSDSVGVLLNKDKTTLIQAPGALSGNYVIPDSVTSIGKSAFEACRSLSSITIPDSVTSIDGYAFSYCTNLTNVYYGGTAEQWAQITIGTSNTDLEYANIYFMGEEREGTCGDNLNWTLDDEGTLTISGAGDMEDYDQGTAPWNDIKISIKEVVVEDGVTSIGSNAFFYCKKLESVSISGSVFSVGANAFEDCYMLTDIEIGNGVSIIGDNAFNGCTYLESIVIPDSVTTLGEGVFSWCTHLKSVSLPSGMTEIGFQMFYNCGELTSIALPAGIKSIGGSAFQFSGLTSITIPDSVTTIGDSAFKSCDALENIILPASLKAIQRQTFWGCKITSITIPDSVTSIDEYAFTACENLTSITIPDSVISIGARAFGCRSLTTITIPDSVTNIGYQAFSACTSLETVYYAGTAEQWAAISIEDGNEPLTNATLHTVELTGITVKTQPTKTEYLIGEGLDTTGLTLIATYSDGSTETVTEGFTTSGFSSAAVGTKTITVTYEGYTATFTVEVKAAEPEVIFGEEALHNLRLQDLTKIGYAFSITTDEEVDVYGVLIWTGDADAEVTVDTEGVQNKILTYDSGFYTAVSDGIYAQRLDTLHYAKPYVKIGDQYIYGSVDTYSPLTYAQTILDGTDEELKRLMIGLLNYGAYAQLYFAESNKEAAPAVLVNDILTDEQKIMNWSDDLKVATPTATKDTANTLDTKWYGTNLNLLDAIQMNMAATGDIAGMYYWTEDAYNSAEILDGASASGLAVIRTDGDYTIGGITGIVAQSVNNVYYVCGYDANGNIGAIRADSVAAYATRLMESSTSTEATVNLAKGLLIYGNSAAAYFAQNN